LNLKSQPMSPFAGEKEEQQLNPAAANHGVGGSSLNNLISIVSNTTSEAGERHSSAEE
jgi:hypothetical protein